MAKITKRVKGDFDTILKQIDGAALSGSISATYEDGSDYSRGDFRCAVRVYERYSYLGKNRVSLTVVLAGTDGDYFLTVITAGGSQAMFFKINRWGEEAFLDTIRDLIEKL